MGKISPFEIFGETFASLLRWARIFLPVAALPAMVSAAASPWMMNMLYPDGPLPPGQLPENFWSIWSVMMIVVMSLQFLQLSLYDAVMDGRDDWLAFGLSRGLRRLLPTLIGLIIYAVAYMIGGVFLVIPGIMALVLLSMMLPLILLEGVNPFSAISRSWNMVWGNAWRYIGATILVFLPMVLVTWPLGSALGILSFDLQRDPSLIPGPMSWQTLVWSAFTTVTAALAMTFYLVVYRSLKNASGDDAVVAETVTA